MQSPRGTDLKGSWQLEQLPPSFSRTTVLQPWSTLHTRRLGSIFLLLPRAASRTLKSEVSRDGANERNCKKSGQNQEEKLKHNTGFVPLCSKGSKVFSRHSVQHLASMVEAYLLLLARAHHRVGWGVFCPATFPSQLSYSSFSGVDLWLKRHCNHACGLLYTFTISFLTFSSFHPLHSCLGEYWKKQNELEENSSKTGCGVGQTLATILTGWEVWGHGPRPVFVRAINRSVRKSSLSVIPEGTDVETPGRKMKLGTHIFTRMSVEKNSLQQHCKREHWGHMGPDLIQSHVRWQILYKPLRQLGDKWNCDGTPCRYPWAEKMMANWMNGCQRRPMT